VELVRRDCVLVERVMFRAGVAAGIVSTSGVLSVPAAVTASLLS